MQRLEQGLNARLLTVLKNVSQVAPAPAARAWRRQRAEPPLPIACDQRALPGPPPGTQALGGLRGSSLVPRSQAQVAEAPLALATRPGPGRALPQNPRGVR